jgi:GT2 family glycosyltransferase
MPVPGGKKSDMIVPTTSAGLGVVIIGRNEGERLRRCLNSVPEQLPTLYVDSGSTDGSVALAHGRGAHVVELDAGLPFTAARARKEGFDRLLDLFPQLKFVQFLDGDCEVEADWFPTALAALGREDRLAGVCGRRRERHAEASFYNRLCDEEWNTAIGEAAACGGDALYLAEALRAVGSFDPKIVAGEEPELCQRLRAAGWKIRRIDGPMTIHDADMHHLRQWWLRAVRSGFGYAQVWHKTSRQLGDTLYQTELARSVAWTLGVAALGLVLALLIDLRWLLISAFLWLAQLLRLWLRHGIRKAALLMLGKFAEVLGASRYALGALRSRSRGTIFYK